MNANAERYLEQVNFAPVSDSEIGQTTQMDKANNPQAYETEEIDAEADFDAVTPVKPKSSKIL